MARVTHTEYERVCPVGERWALPVRGTMVNGLHFTERVRRVGDPPVGGLWYNNYHQYCMCNERYITL